MQFGSRAEVSSSGCAEVNTEVCNPGLFLSDATEREHMLTNNGVMQADAKPACDLSPSAEFDVLATKRAVRTCMAFQWTLSGPALMRRWRSSDGQRVPPAPRYCCCCSHSSPSSSSSDETSGEPPALPLTIEAGAGGAATAASDAGSKGDCTLHQRDVRV